MSGSYSLKYLDNQKIHRLLELVGARLEVINEIMSINLKKGEVCKLQENFDEIGKWVGLGKKFTRGIQSNQQIIEVTEEEKYLLIKVEIYV